MIKRDQVPAEFVSMVDALLVFPIYKMAVNVLTGRNRESRQALLMTVPDELRERVEKEARRLFELRNKK